MLGATNISTCQASIFAKNSTSCHNLPYHLITFFFGTDLVLGFPPHSYILWLTLKEMIRGQSVEVFIFNTSLVEVIFKFSFPFVIKQYYFNCYNCRYVTVILGLFLLVGRPMFQTFTCVERYVAVLHPVIFLKFKPIKYRITISIIGWILIFSSGLLVAFGVFDIYNLTMVEYIVFLSTKVFTCLMVLRVLKRTGPGDDVKKKDGVNKDKVKAFRIIQIVLASSLLSYAPVVFCLMLYNVLAGDTFLMTWAVCLCSGIMTGFVQPYLYLKRVRKICLCFSG